MIQRKQVELKIVLKKKLMNCATNFLSRINTLIKNTIERKNLSKLKPKVLMLVILIFILEKLSTVKVLLGSKCKSVEDEI